MSSTLQLFCAITPGLEPLLAAELTELLPGIKQRDRLGGIELRTDHAGMWRIATHSRVCESLRTRIGRFEARNFAALEAGLRRLPWEAWLPRGSVPEVRVVCHKSALMHTGAVGERVLRSVAQRWQRGSAAEGPDLPTPPVAETAGLHVRIHHDAVQVSVDASGELLHRRGWRQMVGRAPLRETLAAACLQAAEVPTDAVLWDPFGGSGTLAIEHLLRASGRPAWTPGRRYAFELWPVHDAAAWEAFLQPLQTDRPTAARAVVSDRNPAEIEAARANAEAAGVGDALVCFQGDFADALELVPRGAAVLTNLPYGHRTDARGLSETFARFGRLLRRRPDLRPVTVLSGHPAFERQASGQWRVVHRFDNRGLRVQLLALQR